jgi:hypothetical protein
LFFVFHTLAICSKADSGEKYSMQKDIIGINIVEQPKAVLSGSLPPVCPVAWLICQHFNATVD